jgi:16S rRNA (cytidine1402-2'-O)-methyltransferase
MEDKVPGKPLAPGLYIVATPIGNLRDITLRALDVLKGADAVLCEDTRITSRLFSAYGIDRPLVAYHDHNARKVMPRILDRLRDGQVLALVSDAGTPLVSDPGYRLVRQAVKNGVAVTPIPGASAMLAALAVAGLPTDRFLFAGFLPEKSGARKRALEDVADIGATLVFYESPRRLAASLADMADVLGARDAAVCRELTKLHEEARRGPLDELARHYNEAGAPRGEVVVLVGPPAEAEEPVQDVDALLRAALEETSLKDAAARVARLTGAPKREVYNRALELASKGKAD